MNRRVGEVVLIAIALVLTLYGVLSDSWFAAAAADEPVRIDIGLREATVCRLGACESIALTQLESSKAVTMGGNVAFFAGLLASVLAAIAAALHLSGRPISGPISPARLAVAFFVASSLGALLYLGVRPGRDHVDLAMGAAGPMMVAGGVFGAIGAGMIAAAGRRTTPRSTWDEPVDSALAPSIAGGGARSVENRRAIAVPPARGPMAPACPQCAAPTEYAEAYQRWFCRGCRAYV